MKRTIVFLLLCILAFGASYAQGNVDKKITKVALKDAKRLQKEGWKSFDGNPIDEALCRTRQMEAETLQDGSDRYLKASESGESSDINDARDRAEGIAERALLASARAYVTNITSNNQEKDESTFESLTNIQSNGTMFSHETTLCIYRETPKGYEVQVTMMIDKKNIR